jgi:hypothetical protein
MHGDPPSAWSHTGVTGPGSPLPSLLFSGRGYLFSPSPNAVPLWAWGSAIVTMLIGVCSVFHNDGGHLSLCPACVHTPSPVPPHLHAQCIRDNSDVVMNVTDDFFWELVNQVEDRAFDPALLLPMLRSLKVGDPGGWGLPA